MNKNVLVVVAHPDDEVLGCAGTIAKLSKNKHKVHLLILAEGITSRSKKGNSNLKKIKQLHQSTKKVVKLLKIKSYEIMKNPDNRLYKVDFLKIVQKIENLILKIKPETILTHHSDDLNLDHQIVSRAVVTASRPLPNSSVKKILTFETPSSTEWNFIATNNFNPNYFEDVSKFMKTKLKAMNAYKSEMRKFPHPRSKENIISLAKVRGSTVGLSYAEAFKVVFLIKK